MIVLPRAEAVAIAGSRFLAVGTNEKVQALATGKTHKINLEGQTVVPGFIDAHTHPAEAGLMHLRQVDCDLRSIAEIRTLFPRARPKPLWRLGSWFQVRRHETSDSRPLTREDLDAAAPEHPVYISHRGGHTGYVNALGYSRAGVSENTPDPGGGRLDRDPKTGKLNGRISERASEIFDKTIGATYSSADYREGVKLICKMIARRHHLAHGAWGMHDFLRGYQDAHDAGEFPRASTA